MSDSNLIISAYGLLEITFVFVKPVWLITLLVCVLWMASTLTQEKLSYRWCASLILPRSPYPIIGLVGTMAGRTWAGCKDAGLFWSIQTAQGFPTWRQSSGAVWKSRRPSWAPRPNEPYGFCGRKATLNHAHALVTVCPEYVSPTSEDIKLHIIIIIIITYLTRKQQTAGSHCVRWWPSHQRPVMVGLQY